MWEDITIRNFPDELNFVIFTADDNSSDLEVGTDTHPLFSNSLERIKKYNLLDIPRDEEGNTPLHVHEDVDIINLLLARGHNPNSLNKKLKTPIHRRLSARQLLPFLENGSKVNTQDADGDTPIYFQSDKDSINLLLEYGADIYVYNNNKYSPTDCYLVKEIYRERAILRIKFFLKKCKWYRLTKLAQSISFNKWYYSPEERGALLAKYRFEKILFYFINESFEFP